MGAQLKRKSSCNFVLNDFAYNCRQKNGNANLNSVTVFNIDLKKMSNASCVFNFYTMFNLNAKYIEQKLLLRDLHLNFHTVIIN